MDTPGIDSFGLEDLKHRELVTYFSEWEDINQKYFSCKFKNCRHDCDLDCGIRRFPLNLRNDTEDFEHISTDSCCGRSLCPPLIKKAKKITETNKRKNYHA